MPNSQKEILFDTSFEKLFTQSLLTPSFTQKIIKVG